ncbi:hypothetical protein BJ996_000319 [Streptomyces phaeogriseichromatogenes]|nr:hypothetical protein [Streptomyces murinus]
MAAAGPVLKVLTPELLADVFGVHAHTERHADGVIRITYAARPLARDGDPQGYPRRRDGTPAALPPPGAPAPDQARSPK